MQPAHPRWRKTTRVRTPRATPAHKSAHTPASPFLPCGHAGCGGVHPRTRGMRWPMSTPRREERRTCRYRSSQRACECRYRSSQAACERPVHNGARQGSGSASSACTTADAKVGFRWMTAHLGRKVDEDLLGDTCNRPAEPGARVGRRGVFVGVLERGGDEESDREEYYDNHVHHDRHRQDDRRERPFCVELRDDGDGRRGRARD